MGSFTCNSSLSISQRFQFSTQSCIQTPDFKAQIDGKLERNKSSASNRGSWSISYSNSQGFNQHIQESFEHSSMSVVEYQQSTINSIFPGIKLTMVKGSFPTFQGMIVLQVKFSHIFSASGDEFKKYKTRVFSRTNLIS